MASCAGAVRELLGESGDRLLHWDLHYDNVLASYPGDRREPWLVIDPKPRLGSRIRAVPRAARPAGPTSSPPGTCRARCAAVST